MTARLCLFFLFACNLFAQATDACSGPVRLRAPQYPELARQAQLKGVVLVTANVDSEGAVRTATAQNGHKLLQEEAESNIKQWQIARGHACSIRSGMNSVWNFQW